MKVPGKDEEELETEIITYQRKKKQKGKRQKLLDKFTPEEFHHELTGEDRLCPDCRQELKDIGQQCIRQELVYIPAKLKRVDHIQHSYKCEHCSQNSETDQITKAPVPKPVLNHSLGSASIIAHTIYEKYALKVPAYRQEADWNYLGLPIKRNQIINWHIKSSEYYLQYIYNLLQAELVKQEILHADETPYTVLESDTSKTYYWTFLTGKHNDDKKITLYHHGSRKGQEAADFLNSFNGYLHTDQYSGYKKLPDVTLVGCWAHLRRKFVDASPQRKSEKSAAQKAIRDCDKMFRLEQEWDSLSVEDRYQKRQEILKPLMEEFFNWCRETQTQALPNSKLGEAFKYALNHEEAFKNVVLDGRLVLSNNMAERSIKSVIMGRKNWLFSQSYTGAKASAVIMSLVETAKRNDLNIEKYFTYLLEKLPNEDLNDRVILEAYLPWSEKIQS
ncbi:MAG: IS66 family transposase, partial [Ruminococcus flavefaciens]|nr:IS66 family transposase [Ruminococcus flavefaciens]